MAQPVSSLPADLFSTGSDDNAQVPDVESALDDILGSSDMMIEAGISTRNETDDDADDAEDDDQVYDESGDEEDEDDNDDTADEGDVDEDDDESTDEDDDDDGEEDESDDDAEDDVDWAFKVPVKIDGEASEVDLGELVKGYQTSQHLSKKGRELADERKEFESKREEELQKVTETAKLLEAQSAFTENTLAEEYAELQADAKAAKKDGDSYKADEIKERMEEVQAEYWKARKTREKIAEAVKTQAEKDAEKQFEAQIQKFNEEIGDYVPDFTEEKATSLREFAISKGIPEEVLTTLADARIIGALNEFMELSQKVSKGSAKRKAAPKRTPTSTKKTKPTSVKNAERKKKTSERIQSGKATEEDFESSLDDMVGKYFG